MNKRTLCFWLFCGLLVAQPLLGLKASAWAHAEPADPAELNKLHSPSISGDTLYITGRIDSHISDFFSREARAIQKISKVELNSISGNQRWAMDVARKIQQLGKITVLPKGNFCASACIYLFAAGKERLADKSSWLGVHAARLGPIYANQFKEQCFVEIEEGSLFEPRRKGCQSFLDTWYDLTMAATLEGFGFMESNGVSPELRDTYLAMADDENWFEHANVLRKPDWYLGAPEALKFNLLTRILK